MTTFSSSPFTLHCLNLFFLVVFSFLVSECKGNISRFFVPQTARVGDTVYIICEYNLSRGQKLYTLKWYKEEKEFWRHEPRMKPALQYFNVTGINVDRSKSNKTHLLLKNLSIDSGGSYSCELSIDGTYDTDIQDGRMTVLPSTSTSSRRRNGSPPLLSSSLSSTVLIMIVSLVTGLVSWSSSGGRLCS